MKFIINLSLAYIFFLSSSLADWPQFLGPNRNGNNANESVPLTFKNNEPTFAWTRDVGFGFAGPVSFNKIVYIFHRENDNSIVDAISQNTGRKIWTFTYPTDYVDDFGFDKGPRACLLYTSPSPRDQRGSRMPSSA